MVMSDLMLYNEFLGTIKVVAMATHSVYNRNIPLQTIAGDCSLCTARYTACLPLTRLSGS
jgi:hypothetical protein